MHAHDQLDDLRVKSDLPLTFVISYPRSGNTMLMRTLAPLLDAHIFEAMPGVPDYFNKADYTRNYPNIRLVKDHVAHAHYRDDSAIMLIRDGRDVVVSLAYMTLKRGRHSFSAKSDLPDFIRWLSREYPFGDWSSHMRQVRHLASGQDKLLVRYEDILSKDGANVFAQIVRFSVRGLSLSESSIANAYHSRDNVLEQIKNAPGNEFWGIGAEFTPDSMFYEWSKNRKGSSWRQSWDAEAKKAFHDTGATDFLIEYGYETDPDWWRQ